MSKSVIEKDFHKTVSDEIRLVFEKSDYFRVLTPFMFDDGDYLVIVLKKEQDGWIFSDEGHTYMRLSYDIEDSNLLRKGTRKNIIDSALSIFKIIDRDGELIHFIENHQYGDALYSFVQGILKIIDVLYLSKKQTYSSFIEDVYLFMKNTIPENRLDIEWYEPDYDQDKMYPIDYRINGAKKPIYVFALPNDSRTKDATITIQTFSKWKIEFDPLGIFENREELITNKVSYRFDNVCNMQYPTLEKDKIKIDLQKILNT